MRNFHSLGKGVVLFAALAVLVTVLTASAAQKSLYQRLGGYDALAAVTDDFIGRLAAETSDDSLSARATIQKSASASSCWISCAKRPAGRACTSGVI